MSEHVTASSTVPTTPGEKAAVTAQDAAHDAAPGEGSTPTGAAGGALSGAGHDPSVVSGDDADDLVLLADEEQRMPADHASTAAAAQAATPAAARQHLSTGVSGETEVECPGCALVLVGESPRPTAAWFCPRCDYPLFWATPPPEAQPPSARARRRLPGTGGRAILGAEPCWHCGEMGEPDATTCLRCAATLPKPPAPVPTVAGPVNPVPLLVAVPTSLVTWPFVVAGTLGGLAVGIAGAVWAAGLG